MNPDVNATFRVRPSWVFGLNDKQFTESPTRWESSGREKRRAQQLYAEGGDPPWVVRCVLLCSDGRSLSTG